MLGCAEIVAFVATTNFDKARFFYEGVLGLKFVNNDGFALVMEANRVPIRIAKVGRFTPAQFTVLGWKVEDIQKTASAMKKKGVRFDEPIMTGIGFADHAGLA